MEYRNFQDAYLCELEKVYKNPDFINQPRGFKSKECLGCSFTIRHPIDRVCYLSSRKTNIIFNFAEALWYLSGSNSLEFISYYAKNMKKYSSDGKILTGTAYGPKIFKFGINRINQWERVINILKEDPDSKRAFIEIFDANESLYLDNIDVTCTIGLQFFVREGSLHMCSYMRANDAYRGVVSDIFSFSLLQEIMATEMNLKVGTLRHNVGTYHIYEPDNKMAERVIEEGKSFQNESCYSFPMMPAQNNWFDIRRVIDLEEKLRTRQISIDEKEINNIEVDSYWKQVITLLAIYQGIYYEKRIDTGLLNYLQPIYKYLVQNKWKEIL